MLKPTALANATTTVFAIFYIACALIAFIAPNLYFGVLNSWFHSFNLDSVKSTTSMSLPTTLFGIVTFSAYIWIATFAVAKMYHYFANK